MIRRYKRKFKMGALIITAYLAAVTAAVFYAASHPQPRSAQVAADDDNTPLIIYLFLLQ